MRKQANNPDNEQPGGKSGEKIPRSSSTKRKTPKQVMDRQIRDKHAVITDEEFKNLETGTDSSPDTQHERLEIDNSKDRPKDEDKDPKITTPWDVIN